MNRNDVDVGESLPVAPQEPLRGVWFVVLSPDGRRSRVACESAVQAYRMAAELEGAGADVVVSIEIVG